MAYDADLNGSSAGGAAGASRRLLASTVLPRYDCASENLRD